MLQLLRSPQIKLILNEVGEYSPAPLSKEEPTPSPSQEGIYGRDYTVEQENGTIFVRILPPNVRDLSEEHLGNLFTLGMKHSPKGFVLIGRPDFTEAAYTKAQQFSTTYSKHVLLYPAYEICERYIQTLEGTATFQLDT